VAASDGCEKAIRGLVEPGGFADFFKDIAVKGFAGSTAELFRAFFDGLFGPLAALARPLFAAFLEKVGGRGAVDQLAQKLLEFVQKARAAAQCLNQHDDVWKEAAERASVDVDTLKHVVRQLAGKGEEEIRRRVEELAKSLEEVDRQLRAISISPDATYFYAGDWLAGREEDGKLKLCNVFMGDCGRGIYVEYVPNKLEETVVNEVKKKAVEGGGLIVVRGAKGIGKSTAVLVALYRVLQLPLKVDDRYYKPVVVAVREYDKDEAEKFIHTARGLGLYPVFYLDPSKPRAYPKKPTGLYQPEMSIEEVRSALERLRDVTGGVAVVVLSNDQHQAVNDLVSGAKVIDADQLLAPRKEEKADFVKDLVEKYSGCRGEAVKNLADAIASQFDDGYAVAAVLAADWLKKGGCYGEEVERAVERAKGDVHRFVLHYLWYGLFRGDNVTAERYAPLLLAVGFYGPHPPKLAEAIVRAFGKEPEDAVVRWFSQPLYGTLYEAIRKVAFGAVYRRFKVGNDELCQGSKEGPCRLVEICSNKALVKDLRRRYSGIEEVAEEYTRFVAKALEAPGPTGVRQIDFLIDDFLQAFNGVAEDGHWRIRYETEGSEGVKTVEDVVDELDILTTLYGLDVLSDWYFHLEPLREWYFVGSKKVGLVRQYLFPLLRERGNELIKRAIAIVRKIERQGSFTAADLWRAVGISAAGQWDNATDEELEKAVRLAAVLLGHFATISLLILVHIEPLLSETWRRVVSGGHGGEGHQRLADWLSAIALRIARGSPRVLLLFLVVGVDKPGLEAVAPRFDALYSVASNAGKLQLLITLLYAMDWYVGDANIVAILLGKPQLGIRGLFKEVAKRIEELDSHLNGIERAYSVARLYPRLAKWYATFAELDKAVKFVEETLKALEELWKAYEEDKVFTEEKLRPYLELAQVPDLGEALIELSQYVFHHITFVYIDVSLEEAVKYAEKACELARKLGYIYSEIFSCGLLQRLKSVKAGIPPIKDLEERWQRTSQAFEHVGAAALATTLGEYVVALVSTGRLGDMEKVLEKWGWALSLYPDALALTYGVLSLFDDQHLEKVEKELPELVRTNLPNLADALYVAVEMGLFAEEIPEFATSTIELLVSVYGNDVVKALFEVVSNSRNLFLSVLVGLTYCKRGVEWGLKLAREAAWIGSHRSKGVDGRLFGELYKALEGATVGNCVTDEVLKAVFKLYYLHV